jgi:hypothetical protein
MSAAAAAGAAAARKPPTPTRLQSGVKGGKAGFGSPRQKAVKEEEEEQDETSALLGEAKPFTPRGNTFKEDLHLALTDPQTPNAKAFFSLVMLAILGSMVSYLLESMARYEHWHGWRFIELVVVAIFTVELSLRFYAWPKDTASFLRDPLTLVDVLSLLPFYLEFVTDQLPVDLRWLRILRLINLFKVVRVSSGLSIMFRSVGRSVSGLFLLTFFMCQALVLFSSLMWGLERGSWDASLGCYARDDGKCSPFQSIVHAMWWAITTMTTVGYGDTSPITVLGRYVAGFAMLGGIIMLALPTTVFGAQFAEEYNSMKAEAALTQVKPGDTDLLDELAALKTELKQLRDESQRLLPSLHARLADYLEPSGRSQNFQRGVCVMVDAKDTIGELFDLVEELSPDVPVALSPEGEP